MSLIVVSTTDVADLPEGWTPKPTYDEVVAALRALVRHSPEAEYDGRYPCHYCGGHLREPEWRYTREKRNGIAMGHESYCEFDAAEKLMERIDAEEKP